MNVFVAGGAHSMVYGNFQRNLITYGMDIIGHVSMEAKSYTGIPIGVSGVLIMKDMINHELSGKVVADAKARNIPYALVERKWAKAQIVLTNLGFIKTPATDTRIKAMDIKPVVDFVTDIRKIAGRTATIGEVRKKFPLISGDEYNVALGLASKHVQVQVLDDKEVAKLISAALATDYSLVLAEGNLMEKAAGMFPHAKDFITLSRVRAAIQDMLLRWKMDSNARENAIRAWAVTRYTQFKKDGTGWITWADMIKVVKPIFGIGGDWDWFCDARSEVFGPWARKTVHLSEAWTDYLKSHKLPDKLVDLRKEIDEGRLKGFKTGYLYRTSVEAIEEYMNKVEASSLVSPESPPRKVLKMVGISDNPVIIPHDKPILSDVVHVPDVGFVAMDKNPKPVETATPIDAVALADLVETGIKIQLDKFLDMWAEDSKDKASQFEAFAKAVLDSNTANMALMNQMKDMIKSLSDEVKTLKDQIKTDAAKTDAATAKALHMGHTLLNATGAEVRFVLGNIKG